MAFQAERAFSLLQASHENGRLAHAYLLFGETGSGKRKLALDLINLVSDTSFRSLDEARGERIQVVTPESKSRRIRVSAMRSRERRLHRAVPAGTVKVAVVTDADRLVPEAANAFLKTLEEPPPQSLILLLTAQPGQLLDTTRSRCLQVPLFRPGPPRLDAASERLLEELRSRFSRDDPAGLSFAFSLMQAFVTILREEKEALQKEHSAALKEEVAAYRQTTEGDWLKQREEYYKGLSEAHYLARREELVQVLLDWYGDALRAGEGVDRADLPGCEAETVALGERLGRRELLRRIEALEELREHLQTNVHEGLALEVGFLAAFA